MKTHNLKSWPVYFRAVIDGSKSFEIRRFDREYEVGDCLVLQEWEPEHQRFTGETFSVRVMYVTTAFLPYGTCVMGIEPWAAVQEIPIARPKLRGGLSWAENFTPMQYRHDSDLVMELAAAFDRCEAETLKAAAAAIPSSPSAPDPKGEVMNDTTPARLTVAESDCLIKWLGHMREDHQYGNKYWLELTELIARVQARPATDIYHDAWPDGSLHREKWMLHVWHHVPTHILSQACIHAKEDTGPHYLMFMEPVGYVPKADFTCWICGKPTPHPHTQIEIEAAQQTLKVFHDNVWTHLCEAQASAGGAASSSSADPQA